MGKTTTEMQLVPLSKLVPYVNNARTHSPEQLTKLRSSLREFGFINPVIIDRDFNVIAGHGRIAAAKEEGITEVPCVFVDYLTEAQKKAYILADNRMALDAGWDEELLRIESYQHIPEGAYGGKEMPATTEQAVIMLASHFYESRDGSTGGFFSDNTNAAQQVWHTVNLLLRLDREWKV